MKVTDIAAQIYIENGSPTDTSQLAIQDWIRNNVGKLNTLLYEHFYLDPTTQDIFTEAGVEIGLLPAAIVVMMYKVYRTDLDIRNIMSGLSIDTVIEGADQEFRVKRINRSEVLKTLATLKKDYLKEMIDLVHYYRSYNGEPVQVVGDDIWKGYYHDQSAGFIRDIYGGGY
jgi:hypothetical protein